MHKIKSIESQGCTYVYDTTTHPFVIPNRFIWSFTSFTAPCGEKICSRSLARTFMKTHTQFWPLSHQRRYKGLLIWLRFRHLSHQYEFGCAKKQDPPLQKLHASWLKLNLQDVELLAKKKLYCHLLHSSRLFTFLLFRVLRLGLKGLDMALCQSAALTLSSIPPTNIRLGITVPGWGV